MIENLASLRAQFASRTDHAPHKLQRLSLEQQKKRAKELLRQWRAAPTHSMRNATLGAAQQAIARQYGFTQWAEFKAHIEQLQIEFQTIERGEPSALDADHRALHIRCGSDIRHALAVAGFVGDFLVFADPYVHGPVPQTHTEREFIDVRAKYISSDNNPPYATVLEGLTHTYAALDKARDYDAVYLWFEHDSFDQLILAKLLDYFSQSTHRPPVVKMINVTQFAGVDKFKGIGELPPPAMRMLWQNFAIVTAEQYTVGQHAWRAIRSSTPAQLQALVATSTPGLPTMAKALDRHLKQLPSVNNGLGLTEVLALQILQDKGAMSAVRLFDWYTNHYEPLPFMGDTGFWHVLEDLAGAECSAVDLTKNDESPASWQLSITEVGQALLQNKADWLALNHIDRWVGGINIDTRSDNVYRVQGQIFDR